MKRKIKKAIAKTKGLLSGKYRNLPAPGEKDFDEIPQSKTLPTKEPLNMFLYW